MESLMDFLVRECKRRETNMKPTDFIENGIVHCGICGEAVQDIVRDHNGSLQKVAKTCKCEREEAEQRRKKQTEGYIQELRQISKKSMIEKNKRESMLGTHYQKACFDRAVTEGCEAVYKKCRKYATSFSEAMRKNIGLLLWGEIGTGKSFFAACIANSLLEQGYKVVMVTLPQIMQTGKEEANALFAKMTEADLLILDDLGKQRNTAYGLEQLFSIVDTRYQSNKPVVVTTNLTTQEMMEERDSSYSAVYDRILEMCHPINVVGKSFRLKKAFERYRQAEAFLIGDDFCG